MFAGDDITKTTGLSYVVSSLMERFYDTGKYEISYVSLTGNDVTSHGLHAQGDIFAEKFADMKIYNAQLTAGKVDEFDKAITEIRPTIIVSCHDPWILDQIAYSSMRETYVWIAYMPIEAPEYPETVMFPDRILSAKPRISIKNIMSKSDALIPYTPMGKSALLNMGLNPTEHVYLGVDPAHMAGTAVSKLVAFDNKVSEDTFIFMTMGLNHERKRIDKVVESFSKFIIKVGTKSSNKYRLYMHTDTEARTGGTDINSMAISLGLQDYILRPAGYKAGVGVSQTELHKRYSACDCYIGLPSGEGFGYGIANAMMHGKPIIYIDYGGHVNYCSTAGLSVRVNNFVYARNGYIKQAIADTDDAAKKMARMVSDTKTRDRLSYNASNIAKNELYWDVVFPKFMNIVNQAVEKCKPRTDRQSMFRRII